MDSDEVAKVNNLLTRELSQPEHFNFDETWWKDRSSYTKQYPAFKSGPIFFYCVKYGVQN